jgi:predicted secreted protein
LVIVLYRYGKGTQQIKVRIGDAFVVELPVRATAGYAWEVTRQPETVRLEDKRIGPASAAIGGSAIQEFEFAAISPGEETLMLTCKRPWEATVVDRLEVKVTTEC